MAEAATGRPARASVLRAARLLGALAAAIVVAVVTAPALAGGGGLPGGPDGGGGPIVEPIPFEGCGVLELAAGGGCYTFITHNGRFFVENVGEFGDGDAVCVIGELNSPPCGDDCGEVIGCILANIIFDAYTGHGALVDSDGPCVQFETADGQRYQLTGGAPAGLSPGEGFDIIGALDAHCNSFCAVPCIRTPSITPGFFRVGSYFHSPGGCPLLLTDDGEAFVLEHGGDHLSGDRVYVSGRVVENGGSACPGAAVPALEDNFIYPLAEVCGQVEPGGAGCWQLAGQDGTTYLMDELGDAANGDVVLVTGAVDVIASACAGGGSTVTLNVVRVERCLPGDVNRDGVVDVDDLIEIFLAWGTGDPWADLTGDNMVDVDDLIVTILSWE